MAVLRPDAPPVNRSSFPDVVLEQRGVRYTGLVVLRRSIYASMFTFVAATFISATIARSQEAELGEIRKLYFAYKETTGASYKSCQASVCGSRQSEMIPKRHRFLGAVQGASYLPKGIASEDSNEANSETALGISNAVMQRDLKNAMDRVVRITRGPANN